MGGKVVVPTSSKVPFSIDCPVRVDTSGTAARPLEMRAASGFVFKDQLIMTGCHGGRLSLSAFAAKGSVSLHLLMDKDTVLNVNDKLVFENPHELVIVSDIFSSRRDPNSKKLAIAVALLSPTLLFHDSGAQIQVNMRQACKKKYIHVGKRRAKQTQTIYGAISIMHAYVHRKTHEIPLVCIALPHLLSHSL